MIKHQSNNTTQENENNWLLLGNNCWHLAAAALWPNCIHTDEQQLQAIKLLRSQIFQSNSPYKTYLEICQRILLTRSEMIKNPGYGISNMPCRFFNSTERGFSLSAAWYEDLLLQRRRSPIYKIELRALAEALLEFSEDPGMDNFKYWKGWFIENNAIDEWMLYCVCATFILINKENAYEKR